ncbi:hypothetical protein TVAG_467910 [Trichomonas vaginalis G3]|uniref:Vesicle transport v-SNARE protein n=1 Tax=Trichomonas vaginalis (strain ATCC PRA-98 / G3) TaxID=412133 RepID=A2E0N1_TRIV3|nr:vesicle transport V-SNARE protein family [Trichomonas vaginalis G3]EAY13776.1 hypothetical protein TVAG_467910 [Trichomonas vaginalis G3]KAI5542707.1 vesicle transport V-SNARE protein family [Trichomonas vaginalis G3]|eukprot:XP_001325999.1 hypothetical protein [Trichomonas vaginalis G3]
MASGSRFDTLLNQVQSKLDTLENAKDEYPTMELDQKKTAVSRGLRDLNTINNNITEMERLIQTMPMRDREFFTQDIVTCRDTYKTLVPAYAKMDEETKRLILIAEQQKRDGVDQDTLNRTAAKLDNANSNLSKAIGLGGQVLNGQEKSMNTLAQDRQALGRIDNGVDNIIDETGKANKLSDEMIRRNKCINAITWIMVVIFLGIIGVMCYFKWVKCVKFLGCKKEY